MFIVNDGGREQAGFKGKAGDCVVRSIAIAASLPYDEVYRAMADGTGKQRASNRTAKRPRSARNGVNVKRQWFRDYMTGLGFHWVATMSVGSGCKVHLRADDLPMGRLVVSLSKHYTAMIDGVIHDTHDPSRNGTRCVYGYWIKSSTPKES
jgi:hypothetical protein